jgi:plasmid replication initiation protein
MDIEILDSKTSKIYKNKKLNQASFNNWNHSDYQIFLLLVSRIGGVDKFGKYLQPSSLKREHVLKAKDVKNTFNIEPSNSYKMLKKSCQKLMRSVISIEQIESETVREVSICLEAVYNKKAGSVQIKFTEEIMPYLAQVNERFILYNLRDVSNFTSIYTTRLYELLQEFKTTGWMVKSINQLRESFGISKDKLKEYSNFKRRTFAPACNEINKHFDWNLDFEEVKEGRRVKAIRFFFKKTIVHEVTNQYTGKTKNFYEKPEQLISKKPKRMRNKSKKNIDSPTPKKDNKRERKVLKKRGLFSSIFSKIFR